MKVGRGHRGKGRALFLKWWVLSASGVKSGVLKLGIDWEPEPEICQEHFGALVHTSGGSRISLQGPFFVAFGHQRGHLESAIGVRLGAQSARLSIFLFFSREEMHS